MKEISLSEFFGDTNKVMKQLGKGEEFLLTYRGKPAAKLRPIEDNSAASSNDPKAIDSRIKT